MRKFRYTTGTKIWLVILQQIFAVLLVVSIVLLSALFDRRMLNTNDILDTSFCEFGLLYGCVSKDRAGTDQVCDAERTV